MYMQNFEKENKGLFIALASILNTKGAEIEMKSDFDYWKENQEIKYTNEPYIGSGCYNGKNGFYFRANRDFFGMRLEEIRDSFPYNIDGYKIECVSISEYETDDDRSWSESVGFIIEKNN